MRIRGVVQAEEGLELSLAALAGGKGRRANECGDDHGEEARPTEAKGVALFEITLEPALQLRCELLHDVIVHRDINRREEHGADVRRR